MVSQTKLVGLTHVAKLKAALAVRRRLRDGWVPWVHKTPPTKHAPSTTREDWAKVDSDGRVVKVEKITPAEGYALPEILDEMGLA